GVKELADMGLIPEGAYRNQAAYEDVVDVEQNEFAQSDLDMLHDAQTSGGLLLAVSADRAEEILNHIRKKGFEYACIIGKFLNGTGRIKITEVI
ncbi:MAG: selenide, water dikinase SelD, partial [Synergistaceae bacterium]|nr:selenide, water dikinase SelD [Synergistaceae bacterium]